MTADSATIDVPAGMLSAAVAPALVAAFIGLAGGPGLAFIIFALAFVIAGAHVMLLAVPLFHLLHKLGWESGTGTVLTSAGLIGAVPAGIWLGPGVAAWGGLFGLLGGGAFCMMSVMRDEGNE